MQPLKRTGRFGDSRGFSLMQMVVTAAIVSTLMTVAVLGLRSARAAMRLNNSARTFAQNVERARLDAIRRHERASVEFTNPTTYEISMDFAGNGTRQTRTFTLDTGVELVDADGDSLFNPDGTVTAALPYADFDWRGRTDMCSMLFPMKNSQGNMLRVQVAGSGDITVNNAVGSVPTVGYATVSTTADIAPNTTVTGPDTRLNVSPCDATSPSPGGGSPSPGGGSPVPAPVGVCSAGTVSLNTGFITIRRNGGSTDSATVTVTAGGTVSFVAPSNLTLTASGPQTFSTSGGAVTYTVSSNNKTRGTFAVKFNFSNCTPVTLNVKVIN